MNKAHPHLPPPFYESSFPDGTLWAQFFRVACGYLIRFPKLADFWISSDGLQIEDKPIPGVNHQTVEHLRLNQVIPLALSRQLKLVLHSAAVEIGNGAIALLGVSGRGKSTLTASFASAGYRFLTDDGLQLETIGNEYIAKPSHPSIRLWEDSRKLLIPLSVDEAPAIDYTPKSRLLAGEGIPYCPEPRPLRVVYFLGEGTSDEITITPVSPRNAIIELVKNSFLLDIEERTMLEHHFSQLTDLARNLSFFELDYTRDYGLLPDVRAAIVRHCQGLSQNGGD